MRRILFKNYFDYFYNLRIILLTPYNFIDKIIDFVLDKL